MEYSPPSKILLLGLDGCCFKVLETLFCERVMPTLQALCEKGQTHLLRSTVPPYTPQAWVSIFTGKNPGKHGILGFISSSGERESYFNARTIHAYPFWKILNSRGMTAGIFNVPMTYPPEEIDGFLVSGMMTPSLSSPFIYPPGLSGIVRNTFDYIIDLPVSDRDRSDRAIFRKLETMMEKRFALLGHLAETFQPDLLFAVFVIFDRLQHLFYKYLDPDEPLYSTSSGESCRGCVRKLMNSFDSKLGNFLEKFPRYAHTLVVSDHGFTGSKGVFYTNIFLQQAGLLSDNSRFSRITPGVLSVLNRARLRRMVPHPLAVRLKKSLSPSPSKEAGRTRVFASPPPKQGIYIDTENPEERTHIKNQVIEELTKVQNRRGTPLVTTIISREECYRGPFVKDFPDIFFYVDDDSFEHSNTFLGRKITDERHANPRGKHRDEGIFIAAGPSIAPVGDRRELHVNDVVPNLLYLMNCPMPGDLDGQIRESLFSPAFLEKYDVTIDEAMNYNYSMSPSGGSLE
jgi:predicted AlkP superfamily phosphohydrolase/phosphomutase